MEDPWTGTVPPTPPPPPDPDLRDAAEHLRRADAAEEAGRTGAALVEYNLAFRDDPALAEVLLRIARLRMDRGESDRARRAYQRYLELRPDDEAVRRERDELLVVPSVAQAISRPATGDSANDEPTLAPSDADCVTFASLFSGREGVHARQWANASGRGGYSPVREPFTAAVARGHLLGAYTVGIYPVRMDGTARFLAFDVDVPQGARGARDSFGTRMKRAHRVACDLVDACASLDLPCLLEDSGHKGRHVWVLIERPVPAAALRRMAEVVLEAARSRDGGVPIEVFPKQSRVPAGGLGNLIKLPLGVHRVTGRRSWLLDPRSGEPVAEPLALLASAATVPVDRVRALIQGVPDIPPFREARRQDSEADRALDDEEDAPWDATAPVSSRGGPHARSRHAAEPEADPDDPPGPSVSPLPQEPPYDFDGDPEVQAILGACPVLAEVTRRVCEGGVLSTDERIVVTHTLGHVRRGPEAVNHLLARALNADPSVFLKSRLRGQPISCPRIRARLKDVTAGLACDCRFDEHAGLYPTPVLHVPGTRAGAVGPRTTGTLDGCRLQADLARAREQAERATRLVTAIEARLATLAAAEGN